MREIADPIIVMDNVGFHHMDIVLDHPGIGPSLPASLQPLL